MGIGLDESIKFVQAKVDGACKHVHATVKNIDTRHLAQQLVAFLGPAVPFITQAALSAGVFSAGLGLTQASGFVLRVSCSTPYAASIVGAVGVGVSSAIAGASSAHCRRIFENPLSKGTTAGARQQQQQPLNIQDVFRDVVLGLVLFKAMGGRFRSIMPSDLRYVGACAKESLPIPVRSNLDAMKAQYTTNVQKQELLRMFRRDGCHHCGKRVGPVIGDHQPPNKVTVEQLSTKLLTAAEEMVESNVFARVAKDLFTTVKLMPDTSVPHRVLQRFYPQCQTCSNLQSSAVRMDRQVLVKHRYPLEWLVIGALVGLRYCYDSRQWATQPTDANTRGRR